MANNASVANDLLKQLTAAGRVTREQVEKARLELQHRGGLPWTHLVAAGVPEHLLSRIDAPIGLDIAASSPGEIAVAVLGGVIAAFRRRKMHAERRGETESA